MACLSILRFRLHSSLSSSTRSFTRVRRPSIGSTVTGCSGPLTVYPPLYYFLSRLAYRDLLSCCAGLWAIVVAGAFHLAEVSHNVFKAW